MTKLSLPPHSPLLSKNFVYGVATASFQIEGGSQDRLPCIWDTFCDTPNKIVDSSKTNALCILSKTKDLFKIAANLILSSNPSVKSIL